MGGPGSGRRMVDFALAEDVEPWTRQPKETDKAFAAFQIYRDMGIERSMRKIQEALGKKQSYNSVLENWSAKWGWGLRSAEWDRQLDRREREAVLKMAEKKAREKLAVAEGMIKVAAKGLLMWSQHLDHFHQNNPNAEPPLSAADVHRLADAGTKLSLLLEGKPTDIREQRAQITVEEKRRGIQKYLNDPRLRAAMKEVAEARKAATDPDLKGNGHGRLVH